MAIDHVESSYYKFLLKSIEPGLDFTKQNQKIFNRVVIVDDIYNMYPYMEVHINDETGFVCDGIISAEGIEFSSKIGSDKSGYGGYLKSEWVWRNSKTNDIKIMGHVGGTTGMSFVHKNYANDVPRIRAWNDTISNIVKDIVKKDFNLKDTDKLFVTETTGKKIRQQAGISDSKYIKELSNIAYSKEFTHSPFLSFFNAAGEFYFCALDDLYRIARKADSNKYKIELSLDGSKDRYTLKALEEVGPLGLSKNKENYKIHIHKFNNSSFDVETTDIKNHVLNKNKSGKILINKDLKNKYPYFSYDNYGLYNTSKNLEDYKGHRNSLYKSNLLNFRINATVAFNPNLVSGRLITLEAGSSIKAKGNKSKEYSGDWLIIQNRIFYDTDKVPYNVMELGKSNVDLDNNHSFKNLVD